MSQLANWAYSLGVALIFLTAVRSLRAAVRQRDVRSFDLLGLPAAIVISNFVRAPRVRAIDWISTVAFLLVPYFLVRLADYLRPVPRWLSRATLVVAFVVPLILDTVLWQNPARFGLRAAISGALSLLAIYLGRTFTHEFRATSGVTARRLAFAAVGIWTYAAVMMAYLMIWAWPARVSQAADAAMLNLLFFGYAVSFVSYYLAFDTPRSWKVRWQRLEQARYLSSAAERDAEERGARAADDLLRATARTVGNTVVVVAAKRTWDDESLMVRTSTDMSLVGLPVSLDRGAVADVVDARQPRDVSVVEAGPMLAARLAPHGTRLLIAPIASTVHTWGVVIAVQRRGSLFPEDDLAMLAQFARYAATALDHAELIAERRERDRRSADQRIREVESRMSLMLDSIKDYAMVILDDGGRVVAWHTGAEHVFGYPSAEVTDEPIGPLFGLASADVAGLLTEARRLGHADHEGLCRRRDGSRFIGATTIRPLEDVEVLGFVVITRDVTAQRDLEDRLRQSQKMEAIGQLAGGIAHDFNNQLTAILGYAEWLEPAVTGENARAELAEIQKAAERAAGLTRQLLAFSRRQLLQPVVINLSGLVDDLLPMLRRVIGEHITIAHHAEDPPLHVRGDRSQMEQVIVNLAVNARDAMPNGGTVTIATRRVWLDAHEAGRDVSPGPYALLEVADTGAGMDTATQARIFEPFFTTKEFGRGTGLGLATVYGIVRQMHGMVRVVSARGEGATFRLYMPAVEEREPAEAMRVASAEGRASATVLLVEDDESVRTFLAHTLERHGYQVLTADRREAAVALARSHPEPIHLLITDVIMPGGTGPELAEAFESLRPGVPILYVSGFADGVMGVRNAFPKATHFLQKPFSAADLLLRVNQILSRA